jgi:hypothetical protein
VPPNRIDLLNSITGVSFPDAWNSKVDEKITVDNAAYPVYLIGLSELIKNKKAVQRYKDLDDLKYLKSVSRKK